MISNCLPMESATDLGKRKSKPRISKTNKMVNAISTAKKGDSVGKGKGTSKQMSSGTTEPNKKNNNQVANPAGTPRTLPVVIQPVKGLKMRRMESIHVIDNEYTRLSINRTPI